MGESRSIILVIARAGIILLLGIFVILPISVLMLVGMAAAGIISGAGIAAYNFGDLVIKAHKTLP